MGRKKSSNGRGSEGGGDASSLSILGKGMHNLKQWKRRTEEQVLGAMGYSDRSKDPKVDAALEKFTQQKEEIQANIKDLKHLGERWRKFFIACAECESMRYRAAGLYDAIAASSAHAAILNAFDERVYNVLDATLVHVKDIEESIKKRQLLVSSMPGLTSPRCPPIHPSIRPPVRTPTRPPSHPLLANPTPTLTRRSSSTTTTIASTAKRWRRSKLLSETPMPSRAQRRARVSGASNWSARR